MLENIEMRKVYNEELIKLAEKDDRIVMLEADLSGSDGSKAFKERFPDRFINVGIAEADMVGIAAGLANYGKIPFAHSFAPFITRRAFDQVTVSVAFAHLNVKLVGSDPGIAAELNGATHMCFEDIAALRSLGGVTIFEPVDTVQLKAAIPQIVLHDGPVYIRLFRKLTEKIYDEGYEFCLGKASYLRDGSDAVIFATGLMVKEALDAYDELKAEGINCKVINIHTIKPIDEEAIIKAAKETGAVVTAENHNIIGGLGGAVSEVLGENFPVPIKRIGVRDHFGEVGKMEYLKKKFNMTSHDIASGVKEVIKRK